MARGECQYIKRDKSVCGRICNDGLRCNRHQDTSIKRRIVASSQYYRIKQIDPTLLEIPVVERLDHVKSITKNYRDMCESGKKLDRCDQSKYNLCKSFLKLSDEK